MSIYTTILISIVFYNGLWFIMSIFKISPTFGGWQIKYLNITSSFSLGTRKVGHSGLTSRLSLQHRSMDCSAKTRSDLSHSRHPQHQLPLPGIVRLKAHTFSQRTDQEQPCLMRHFLPHGSELDDRVSSDRQVWVKRLLAVVTETQQNFPHRCGLSRSAISPPTSSTQGSLLGTWRME